MQKILVVDESASTRLLLEEMLQNLGHSAECAADGWDALARLTPEIALVLLSADLPGLSGYETAIRIRSHPLGTDVPIVMVSALDAKHERLHAVEVGANDFIVKPIDSSELQVQIDSLLQEKAGQDALKHSQAQLEAAIEERTTTLQQASRRLQALLEVARTLNSSLDLAAILQHILSQATELLHAESASVMLLDDETGRLRVTAACGPRARAARGQEQELGQGVSGWVALHGEPLLLRGELTDPRFVAAFPRQDIQDAICVPLRTGDEVLGVINVSNRWNVHPFTPADLEFMQALAHQAVVSIRNAHSFEELERQRYTVERLLHELGRAQQAERARVAREIHDGPAQTFFAGLRNAQAVRALLAAGGEAREVASELEVILRQGIAEIRAVMIDLQPPSLDTEPLSAALDTYVRRFEQRTGIDTQLSCHSEREDLPTAVETCLYRIAQEALVNVSKHAEAQHCWVTLEVQERSCFLEVRDDGKGFDLSAADAEATEHLGMSLLNERAMLAGGRLVVETTPGKGTAVTVSVPLLGVAETGSGRTP